MQITQRNKNMSTKWLVVVAACLMVALFVVIAVPPFVGWFINNFNGDDASASIAKPAATSTPSPTPTADDCAPEYVQVEVDRQGTAKVDPRYEERIRPIVNDSLLSPDEMADAIRQVEIELSGSNAQTLATWAQGAGLYADPNKWPELVEDGKIINGACLNEAGKMLHAAYKGSITANGTTVEVGQAPANGTNSGINGDTTVVNESSGLRGDLTAVIFTFADGSKLIKLIRCGNVIWIIAPAVLPPGRTDNPPPPNNPPEKPKTSDAKNRADSVTPVQGWDPQPAGQQTTDHISEDQHASGEVSGNVGQVPSGTQIGTTTPDTGPAVPVQGATPSDGSSGQPAEDTSNDVVDDTVTNQDPGGSTGDTEIAPPPD
jgi:hypothetical protein